MKKWKVGTLAVLASGFVALNLFLIEKKDSKVTRTLLARNWTEVKKVDIIERFETDAVIKPLEEYNYYFNDQDKEFQKFLVKEGDEVTSGTPLFEYITPKLDQVKDELETEKSRYEGEIEGIEEYIEELSSYQETIPDAPSAKERDAFKEAGFLLNEYDSSTLIVSSIQQEIYKQELEKKKLEEKIKAFESQLNYLDEHGDTAMTASETEGIVKKVNKQLGSPIVTIASNTLAIEGFFNEQQVKKTEPGMKIIAKQKDEKEKIKGLISVIQPFPETEASVGTRSKYAFQATMKEDPQTLIIGSKVRVSVVTAEAKGVPSLPKTAIDLDKKPSVYRLNGNGTVTKEVIATGLEFAGIQEVKDGIELGAIIISDAKSLPYNKSAFITPLQAGKVKISAYNELSKRQKLRFILIGLLEK
ncbi:efflux RND transporter periplasmic adaptor subunit [Peribacillus huizhouensis]|uniref:HlyD family secretion protein n=1 Tax=Peribacillus huizhouensis TaxID=1501239 RepID=A0ABR6CW86_9BACI|nr:efflux RND transporter periplasmic adaptor subunit [Peribacillus huizhouensis]MBA9029214.1 HlyD family secretion protein [Peribacillus huizhouensis]